MPWGRLDDSLYDHPKLDEFPTDEATLRKIVDSMPLEDLVRLAGIGLWARSISYANRHLTDGAISRAIAVRKLDASVELADAVAHAELFERTPTGYLVHDFLDFNDSRVDVLERREKEAHRKAEWRKAKRDGKRPAGTTHGTPSTDGPDVTPPVPPGVPLGQERLSRDSRARSRGIRESRPEPDPTRPDRISSERGSSRAPAKRADVQALLDRGFKRVTRPQRKVLDEVLARHDVTGPEFAAEAIRSAPPDADPLEAVMAADALWQQAQRKRADDAETEWDATKATERTEARDRLPWLAEATR